MGQVTLRHCWLQLAGGMRGKISLSRARLVSCCNLEGMHHRSPSGQQHKAMAQGQA